MKRKAFFISALVFALGLLIFAACEKTDTSIDSQSSRDEAKAQSVVADAFAIAGDAAGTGGGKALGCATVTQLTAIGVFPKKFKVEFPAAGCDPLGNGVINKGIILVTIDRAWGEGASLTTEFQNYSHDGNTFSGTITAVYNKALPIPEHTITSTNCVLTMADGKTIKYNSVQNFKLVEGAATPGDPTDNKIEMNGTSNGENSLGKTYTTTATSVIKIYGCPFPVSGTVLFNDATLMNFDEDGNSANTPACNSLVLIKQLGISVVVDLKK
jgi:hypothetical protein